MTGVQTCALPILRPHFISVEPSALVSCHLGLSQFYGSLNPSNYRVAFVLFARAETPRRITVLVSGSDLLKHWRETHKLDGCSPLLISDSGSDLLQHWRETHWLDGCSPVLVSGSDLLKHWRETHCLDGCSPLIVSGSDLFEDWKETHSLDGCSPLLVSGSDPLKHWERLTNWMVFTRSSQWF